MEGLVFRISGPVDVFHHGPYRIKVTCLPVVVAWPTTKVSKEITLNKICVYPFHECSELGYEF